MDKWKYSKRMRVHLILLLGTCALQRCHGQSTTTGIATTSTITPTINDITESFTTENDITTATLVAEETTSSFLDIFSGDGGSGFAENETTTEQSTTSFTDIVTTEASGFDTTTVSIQTETDAGSGDTTITLITEQTTAVDTTSLVSSGDITAPGSETTVMSVSTSLVTFSDSTTETITTVDDTSSEVATTAIVIVTDSDETSTALTTDSTTGDVSATTVIVDITATILEVTTENSTDLFNGTTAIPITPSGFAWYYILIICLGILIVILVTAIIVICCMYKNASKLPGEMDNSEKDIPDGFELQPVPGYVKQAPTLHPEVRKEATPAKNFIADSPMKAPLYPHDPAGYVRKREKVRPRFNAKEPSIDEDEGFNEPLVKSASKPPKKKVRRRKPSSRRPPSESYSASESDLTERTIHYQPYFLPTPVETALTAKSLGDEFTDSAMNERYELQMYDAERRRKKQRLRQQRSRMQNESMRHVHPSIDSVLAPAPPSILQGPAQRRRLQRYEHPDYEGSHPSNMKPKRRKHHLSDDDDSELYDENRPSHEAVIARMAKLLENAYSLLAPIVQRNLVEPVQQQPQNFQVQPPTGQPQSYPIIQPQPVVPVTHQTDQLFTRTSTPPALLPQPATTPIQAQAPIQPERHNDANSVIWTPYRTYDQMTKLQQEDPYLTQFRPRPPQTNQETSFLTPKDAQPQTLSAQNYPGSAYRIPQHTDPIATLPVQTPTLTTFPNQPHVSTDTVSDANLELEYGDNQQASTIVQSIKDTLSKLTGSSTPVKDMQESNC